MGEEQFITSKNGVLPGDSRSRKLEELNRQLLQEKSALLEQLSAAKKSAEEYDKLKASFISNISHEMRTPLNAIVGFSELPFLGEVNMEEMMEYMQIIRKSSLQLLEKIKDIIFISTLDGEDIPVILQTASASDILHKIETFYNEIDDERRQGLTHLIVKYPGPGDFEFQTDAEKVIQVLKKLTDNALKFTPHGSVEVGCQQLGENKIGFYVADTGIGIPSDKFEVIFELFRQADESTSRQYGGSGLGLYIVKRLSKLLDASINVQSEVGTGTRISLTLNTDIQFLSV